MIFGQKTVQNAGNRTIIASRTMNKVLEPNVNPGDDVLILTDTDHDPQVWRTVATCVRNHDGHPVVSIFETRETDYYDPPDSVARQMKSVDLIVTCSTTAMLHSPSGHVAMAEFDVPIIAMDGGITLDMLTQGAATADYKEIEQIVYDIAKTVFEGGSEAHLSSRHGTDLTLSIENRVFIPDEPDPEQNPYECRRLRSGLYSFVFPGGEFNVPPDPTTANGTLVIDTSMHNLGRLDEPIEITIDTGEIVNIEGGYQAQQLEYLLKEYGDEDAYKMPTEMSVGANPKAQVVGNQREDKVMLGCVHVGLGTNADVGGDVESKLHMDGVIARPTLKIDGEIKIDQGKILGLNR